MATSSTTTSTSSNDGSSQRGPGVEEADRLVATAIEAGGSPSNEPADHGFMYSHSYQDLDGHLWEVIWMDPNGMPQG